MGAVIAATVILLVLGASMGLLFAYLDGVDEYNRQASRVSEKQQDAVQENIVLSATLSKGRTYDLNIKNPGSRPAEIIEIRTVHPDGTITVLGDDARMRLEGFSDATLDYVVPDGIESAQLVAITSAGNTFGAEINIAQTKTQGPGDAGSATVNGMGLTSRLADKEYSGHTLYGSELWGREASLKPYTAIDADELPDPPRFAAVILDTDVERTWQITGYDHGELITLNGDGTLSRTPKPNILEYTKVRGDAQVSTDSGGITIVPGSGTQGALLRLDPRMFGQELLFDASVGTGRVEILTSPYGNLADEITIQEIKDGCVGAPLYVFNSRHRSDEIDAARLITTSGWVFDITGFDAFLIHEQSVTPSLTESTSTYEKTDPSKLRHMHVAYWYANHRSIDRLDPGHYTQISDHRKSLSPNLYNDRHRYYGHPGSYTFTYDTQALSFPSGDLLLRDGTKFFVSYEPMMNLVLNVSQHDHPAHSIHRINDDSPSKLRTSLYDYRADGVFYSTATYKTPPHALVQADSEIQFVTPYRPNYVRAAPDLLYGLPIASYMGGGGGNDDYVALNGVAINGIHQWWYDLFHRDDVIPSGADLCVFAQTPYKVHETIASDVQHLRVVMPERVDPYAQHLYIRVHPGDSAVTLRAVAPESIAGAGHAPYRILEDSKTLHTGSASPEGMIGFIGGLPESFSLLVYPESMLYRGSFSTIVFDPHSGESFRIPGPDEHVYTVHTWVQVPIVGDVVVTDLKVKDKEGAEVRLEYLEGAYAASSDDDGRVWIPVIPGYYSIHMKINGVDAVLRYSDVLGATNVKIIEPHSNTVSKVSDAPITVIEAAAGAVAYAIATSDGTMSAIIQGTVSGTAYIDHGYVQTSRNIVVCPRDPLSGWIQIYKNGELYRSGYEFIDYEPKITTERYGTGQTRHIKTTFTYEKHHMQETLSVPVQTGDFVEFYIHSKIFAESAVPGLTRTTNQCGWNPVFTYQSSNASATANIHDGSIIIG